MIREEVISKNELLEVWLGNKNLTRRIVEAFPEKELFSFAIGGMRTFAEMVKEIVAVGAPGLKEIISGTTRPYSEAFEEVKTKEDLLKLWDENVVEVKELYMQIPAERFSEVVKLFGEYEGTVISQITYFIENEIHHRGQGYVYLRALGITPPFFWER